MDFFTNVIFGSLFYLVYLPWSYRQVNSQITHILWIVCVRLQKRLSHARQVTDCCFCFHSILKLLFLKTNITQYIRIKHSYRHRMMDPYIQKHWYHWVPQKWRWHISSTHQCYNTNISSFTSTVTDNSSPKSKTSNDSRIVTSIHLQITQQTQ